MPQSYSFPNLFNFGAANPANNPLKMPRSPWESLAYEREQKMEEPEEDSIMSALRQIQLRKQGPRQQEYENYLTQNTPPVQDRSALAKVVAALSSGIGAAFGDGNAVGRNLEALDMPRQRAHEDYVNRGKMLGAAAEFESGRESQDLAAIKAIADYEKDKAISRRADIATDLSEKRYGLEEGRYRMDVEKQPLELEGMRSVIDNRPLFRRQNKLTGQDEIGNMVTGNIMPVGEAYFPTYGQERTDRNTDENARDIRNYNQSRNLAAYNSSLIEGRTNRLRESDPESDPDYISPAAQANARRQAMVEVLQDKDFNDLLTGTSDSDPIVVYEGGQYVIKRPSDLDEDELAELEMKLQNFESLVSLKAAQKQNATRGSRFIRSK